MRELNVASPLQQVGLTKKEIRLLARKFGLASWDRPSAPCLCSRIPYGSAITENKLRQVESGEELLRELGFRYVTLDLHGFRSGSLNEVL